MRRYLFLALTLLVAFALVPGCEKDTTTSPRVPEGDTGPGVPALLDLAQNVPPILADGESQADVYATVVDGQSRPLENVGVRFTTTRGTVETFAATDADGRAHTTLTSAASATDLTATVTATATSDTSGTTAAPSGAVMLLSHEPLGRDLVEEAVRRQREGAAEGILDAAAGDVSAQVPVKMLGITLTVSANPGTIPADGISTSRVRANLVETTSRVPVAGVDVRFGSSAGAITGRVETDATGTATALLTGTTSGETAQISAYYAGLDPKTTSVSFSALTLTLSAGLSTRASDGSHTTPITARLVNAENNPVSGVSVTFAVDAGAIQSPVVTDDMGLAMTSLATPAGVSTANVTARFGGLSQQKAVNFAAPPATASVLLAAEPATLPADGASRSVLTATVLDGQGEPVLDGTAVTFSVVSGDGSIVSPVRPTVDGTATAIYVAGTVTGYVSVKAQVGSVSRSAQLSLTPLDVGGLALAANKASLLADGLDSAVLTATVTDPLGNPVQEGTAVQFATSSGVIEDVTPTDAQGHATARIRSGRFQTGTGRVTASAAGFQKTVDVKFVSEAPAQIVILETNEPRIGVRGSAAGESAQLTFEVRDRNGIPVDADHAATLSFQVVPLGNPPPVDASVNPTSVTTNHRGRAIANVYAGTISGAIEVSATSGSLVSRPIRVAIHGDLPDPPHFSISFERVNVAGLVYDGLRNAITARVADQWGNPVPDSTSVWFQAEYGIVQGSGFTDDHGEATVWEVTAGPRPAIPGGDGLVTLTAQTVSKAGDAITTSGQVMWSGPTQVEFTDPAPGQGFALDNGGFATLTFRVHDANDNPLTGGTAITVESTAGDLGGDTDIVLPDTQSPGYTTFQVNLSDNDPATDELQYVTVTVKVESQNGNRTAILTGTIR